MAQFFSPKRQPETITLTFDFVNVLGATETISSSTWTVKVIEGGTDPDPSTSMITGTPTISGTKVLHLVTSGVEGITYKIVCEISTSNSQIIQGTGLISVEEDC